MFSRADNKNETEIVSIIFGTAVILVCQQREGRLSHLLYDQIYHLLCSRARCHVQLDAGALTETRAGGGIDAQHTRLCLFSGIFHLSTSGDWTPEVSTSACCRYRFVKAEFMGAGAAAGCRLVLCHAASVAVVTKVARCRRVVSRQRSRSVHLVSQQCR